MKKRLRMMKKTLDKEIDAHIEKYTMEQNSTKDFKFEPEQVEAIKRGVI